MADQRPIPRRVIANALNYLESLKLELEAGLDPEKGFISDFYIQEKLHDLTREIGFMEQYTEEVEPPKESSDAA